MKVYLLRHGETDWNSVKRWQGNTDIGLNHIGIKQAEEVAKRFVNTNIGVVYASNLSRAKTTAEVIVDKAFNNKINLFIENDLAEIKLGEWEGLTYDEVATRYTDDFRRWSTNHSENIGFGVENYHDLQQRAFNIFTKICDDNSEDILIVSHGAWIKALVCKLLFIPLEHKMSFEVGNTGVTIIEVIKVEPSNKFIINTLNDTNHI